MTGDFLPVFCLRCFERTGVKREVPPGFAAADFLPLAFRGSPSLYPELVSSAVDLGIAYLPLA